VTRQINFIALVALAAGGLACASRARLLKPADSPRAELVTSIKDFERRAGFEETANFSRRSNNAHVDYRCYYTGKLKLPPDYSKLKLRRGTPAGCAVSEEKHDLFFYPVEAVAGGNTPLTRSLSSASPGRMLVVIPHEDFHNDSEVEEWPTSIREAASTLIGFLTAAEFAKEHYGDSSDEYRQLAREAEIFLRKAELVNRYADLLTALYDARRSGSISKDAALEKKRELFTQLSTQCRQLPDARSFNKCPSALNNAGLAFDRTYTRHYPLLYQVHVRAGGNFEETLSLLRSLGRERWAVLGAALGRAEQSVPRAEAGR